MNSITRETRHEAYIRKPTPRQEEILAVLNTYGPMTARRISYALRYEDLNSVRPRLTELLQADRVEVVGKKWDLETGRNVAVYKRKDPEATGSDPKVVDNRSINASAL